MQHCTTRWRQKSNLIKNRIINNMLTIVRTSGWSSKRPKDRTGKAQNTESVNSFVDSNKITGKHVHDCQIAHIYSKQNHESNEIGVGSIQRKKHVPNSANENEKLQKRQTILQMIADITNSDRHDNRSRRRVRQKETTVVLANTENAFRVPILRQRTSEQNKSLSTYVSLYLRCERQRRRERKSEVLSATPTKQNADDVGFSKRQ